MANASLSGIYERLNNTSSYHPFSANTFNDWSLEAGDIVTVKSGEKSYSSPVFNNNVSWKGTAESTLNTSGNQTRDSISKVSKQKYSSSTSGITNGQGLYGDVWGYNGLHSQINQTESNIYAYVESIYEGLKSGIDITSSAVRIYAKSLYDGLESKLEVTASSITSTVNSRYNGLSSRITQTASSIEQTVESAYDRLKSGITQTASSITSYVVDSYNELRSGIVQTASSVRSYVVDSYNRMKSGIEQTASSFAVTIVGVADGTGKVTAASIAAAINTQTGTSSVLIDADKINIGSSGNQVQLSNVLSVLSSGDVTITGDVYSTGTFHPNGISMAAGSSLSFAFGTSPPVTYTFSGSNVPTMIVNAVVDNSTNTLTLTKMNGEEVTFRKAIALTGTWSNGTYTVGSHSITPTIELDGQGGQSNFSAVLKDYQDGAETTGATGVSKYIYLVESGSGRTAVVKACANSDGTGAVGQVSVGHLYTEGLSDGGSAGYEEGLDDVTIVKGAWNGGVIQFSKSAGAANNKTVQLAASSATWSGNTATVQIWDGTAADAQHGVNTGYTVSVNATNIRRTGTRDVTISDTINWTTAPSSTITAGTNSLQLSTSGRVNDNGTATEVTKTVSLYFQQTGWSSKKCYVYVTHTSSTDNTARVMRKEVDAGEVYSDGESAGNAAGLIAGKNAVTIVKGSWSNGIIQFSKSEGTANNKTVQLAASSATWSGNTATVQIWDGTAADAQHGVNTGYTVTVNATNIRRLGTQDVTISSTITWTTSPSSSITANTNSLQVSTSGRVNASGGASEVTKTVSLYTTDPVWDGNTAYVYVTHTSTSESNRIMRRAVDASSLVSTAVNAVTLSGPTWTYTETLQTNNTATVSISNSGTPKAIPLYLTQDSSFSSNKKKVYMRQTSASGTIRAQVEVDATSVRYAGRADVTLKDPTWASAVTDYPQMNTVTISTNGRTNTSGTSTEQTKSVALYLTQGTFSSHKKYVNMRVGSTSGTIRARIQVDATTEYDSGYDKGHAKGLTDYYNSSYWNNNTTTGVVTIPNKTNTGSETWFTYNVSGGGGSEVHTHSRSITKAVTGYDSNDQEIYLGKLYYLYDGRYLAVTSNNRYWYYASASIPATTVYW